KQLVESEKCEISTQGPFLTYVINDASCCHDTGHERVQWFGLKGALKRAVGDHPGCQIYRHLLSIVTGKHCLFTNQHRQTDVDGIAIKNAGKAACHHRMYATSQKGRRCMFA